MKATTRFVLGAAALIALTAAAEPTTPPADWKGLATKDVEAGYALMRDNHPGWVDPDNTGFRAQLDQARAAGLAVAARAGDAGGYAEALLAFSTVLADGHAGLRAKRSEERQARWPGFVTAWRGNRLLVIEGEPAPGVGPGTEVVACDSTPIAELIVRRLQPRSVRLNEAGQWWAYGGRVLTDSADTAGLAPQACTFRMDGRTVEATLQWRPLPDDFAKRFLYASNGGYTDIGLEEPRPGMFVVGMPTFANSPDATKLYAALIDAIGKRHRDLAKARAIVLDLRFNQGGSSAWSLDVAKALWGDKAVETRMEAYLKPVEIWWRNAPGNIAYLSELDALLRGQGRTAVADEIKALAGRMESGRAAGQPFTVEEPADTTPAPPPAPPTLDVPVYVITPGQCSSACLDAVDLFSRFPGVRLIGSPTSADSQYMEVRTEALPSGKGEAIIPLKIWTGRPRKGGQVYWPDISMMQLDWSTAAFLDAVDRDLSMRGPPR